MAGCIPYEDFGGKGNIIHLAHANGYPVSCYRQLIQRLIRSYRVVGIHFRPLWENKKVKMSNVKNWDTFAGDILSFFKERKYSSVIGIGHSLGAMATLFAAARQPHLFQTIILLEPVILSRKILCLLRFMPLFLKKRLIPPARISSKRRDMWNSREEAFDHLRKKNVFSKISDSVLIDYVTHGLDRTKSNKFTLLFSKEWETHLYTLVQDATKIFLSIRVPILVVKGENSNVIHNVSWEKWKEIQPKAVFTEIANCGHLLPFEKPLYLAKFIDEYIQKEIKLE